MTDRPTTTLGPADPEDQLLDLHDRFALLDPDLQDEFIAEITKPRPPVDGAAIQRACNDWAY